MKTVIKLSGKLNLLFEAIHFFKKYFIIIISLGLVAAFGRVIQLGGFGKISLGMNILLEVVIESARILIFIFTLGLANIKNGILRIKYLFTKKINRKHHFNIAINALKKQWLTVIINFIAFLLIVSIINYLIDLLAYQTCLLLRLKKDGILAIASSEWTILLFFKNLSVIPFTVVFETILILWLTDKLQTFTQKNLVKN